MFKNIVKESKRKEDLICPSSIQVRSSFFYTSYYYPLTMRLAIRREINDTLNARGPFKKTVQGLAELAEVHYGN